MQRPGKHPVSLMPRQSCFKRVDVCGSLWCQHLPLCCSHLCLLPFCFLRHLHWPGYQPVPDVCGGSIQLCQCMHAELPRRHRCQQQRHQQRHHLSGLSSQLPDLLFHYHLLSLRNWFSAASRGVRAHVCHWLLCFPQLTHTLVPALLHLLVWSWALRECVLLTHGQPRVFSVHSMQYHDFPQRRLFWLARLGL